MDTLGARILKLLRAPQLAALATITADGKPWVRYVMCAADTELTIRCASFAKARKVAQIGQNPEVHLTCGVADPRKPAPYLQIQGRARFSTDEQERHAFWNETLQSIFTGPDDPNYGVLIVTPYRIELNRIGSPEPEVWEP